MQHKQTTHSPNVVRDAPKNEVKYLVRTKLRKMERTIKSIVLLMSILILSNCYSQENNSSNNKKDYYAEIGGGLSIPTSYFGMNNSDNNSTGSANNGLCIYGSYGFLSKKYFGFKFALSINSYTTNNLIDTTFMNTPLPTDVTLITEAGRWTNISLLLGPTFHYSEGKSIFKLSILGGFFIANRPSIGHNFFRNGKLAWIYYISSGKGTSICVRPELSYTYMINERFGIKTYLCYSYSKPTLEYKAEYPLHTNNWKFNDISTTQTITNVDIGVALVIRMK